MLNFSKLLLILFPLLLISYSVNSSNDKSDSIINDANISAGEKNKISLDGIIKCNGDNAFAFSGVYFYYPDYGCIYSDKNKIGDVQVFLFPKNKYLFQEIDSDYNSVIKKINKLKIKDIKNNFYIFVRIIDKSDLVFTKDLDSPYYVKDNPNKHVYYFDGFWKNIDTNIDIDIDIDIDDNPTYFYKEAIKKSKDNNSEVFSNFDVVKNNDKESSKSYSNQLYKDYKSDFKNNSKYNVNSMNIIFEGESDLDTDGSNEIISVSKPKDQDVRNFDVIITIYRIVNGEISLWQENTLMFKDPINGCMMDGFEEIALHPNGFDIEYTSCYDNKHAIRSVSFSYKPQIDDFEVTKNTISFFSPESDGKNQSFDCKDHTYLFSSYSGRCEWW